MLKVIIIWYCFKNFCSIDNIWDDNRIELGYKYGVNSYLVRGKLGCMGRWWVVGKY